MAAKILCYPDSNDTWTFMNKGKRCECGSNCFHYKSVGGVIGAYCNACESLIGFPLEEKEEELMVENHRVSLDFRAFEIKTLRLKLA